MKLLIAAGGAAENIESVPPSIRPLLEAASEILVMTPALPSRLEWLASATDKARSQADERLEQVLSHLDEIGASARGAVGADDPLLAFDDAIADFGPDHILIALRNSEHSGWQEHGLLDALLERISTPLTVFVAGG